MEQNDSRQAILLLDDGTIFEGKAIGITGTSVGEIAFNTGMTGYQEIFTDPSYYGQMLVMSTAHIGNYGVHEDEVESENIKIAGLITKKFSDTFSRPSGSGSLADYLIRDNVVGISDVDTRALVRHIRAAGAQNAIISSEELDIAKLKEKLKAAPSMQGLELSSKVTVNEAVDYGNPTSEIRISLLDLGVKRNIVRCLVDRGAYVRVFPLQSTLDELLSFDPHGIMFSNGPGDPSVMTDTIALTKQLLNTGLPCFGICLGHQIIALSQGLETEKMFNGHRGVNHPVKNLQTGKCEITSQNHGFVVSNSSVEQNDEVELTHIHLNDQTVAGIKIKNKNTFSVQYHPEASAGPHDSRYLFDEFIKNIVTHNKLIVEK